jgi:hypothetical protein
MQLTHVLDAERPFVVHGSKPHYARRKKGKANRKAIFNPYVNFMITGGNMTTRKDRGRRLARPLAGSLARPRELFGESLPELLLLTAVVAAVVTGVMALNAN